MKRTALLLIACAAAVSCSQPENNTKESGNGDPIAGTRTQVAIDSLSYEGKTIEWIEFENEAIFTIRSAEELAEVVKEGSEAPEIDFSRQSVVVAGGTLTHGINGIGAKLELGDDNGLLSVEIMPNEATVMQPWRIAVYTAVIPAGIEVELDMKLVAPGDTISLRR